MQTKGLVNGRSSPSTGHAIRLSAMVPDAPKQYTAFSPALRAEHPNEVPGFDSFESEVEEWQKRFETARSTAKSEQQVLMATANRTANRQISHLFAATAIRIVDLASALILLINERHAHAAFAVSRSISETAAVPAYVFREVVPRLRKGRADQVDTSLRRLTMGVDLGAGFDSADAAPVPVSSLVKSLCSHTDDISSATNGQNNGETAGETLRRTYSMITDHTHPNHHAVHLSATLDENGMDWSRGGSWDASDLTLLEANAYLSMWAGGNAFDRSIEESGQHGLILEKKNFDH